MVPGLVHKRFQSFDGTDIAYQVRGHGPAIVLANGLGGTFEAFRYIYRALAERYRIVCWDYRGLYGSGRPRDLATLTVAGHCRDLERLLAEENIDRAVFIGWSMGVQVDFEYYRHHREQMAGIVAINGTYGTPFRTALASRLARHIIPPWLAIMKAQAPLVSRVSQLAVGWSGLVPTMARLGLVSSAIDADAMREMAEGFKGMDFAIYSDILRLLGEHDARDLLPEIKIPTLIITGDHDLMTPTFTARKMNRLIPGSRLVILPGGSHYSPLEFPQAIQDEILGFLSGVPGWEPERS